MTLKKQIKEKVERKGGNEIKDVEMRQSMWLNECKFEEESLKKNGTRK